MAGRRSPWLALSVLVLIASVLPVAAAPGPATAKTQRETITPLAARVPAPPRPVLGTDGRRHLVYELQLYNWTSRPAELEAVVVRSGSGGVVRRYVGGAIDPLLVQQAYGPPEPTDRVIGPNEAAILWFDISLRPTARPPARLKHVILVSGARSPLGRTRVGRGPIRISPPLRGKGIFNLNGCCGATPHNRAIQTIDGVRWLSQRYAIDFVRIDREGSSFRGDPHRADSYYIFRDPVHAVAPGTITSVLDSRPDNAPPNPDPTLNNRNGARFATGNHVIEKIGPHVYAMYAHLVPNTVRVRVGQRVRRGQVLGRAGNSGNSSAPHLHFQLMSSNSPLGSNGIPYVFDGFELEGRVAGPLLEIDETGRGALVPHRSTRRNQLPLTRTVMRFR